MQVAGARPDVERIRHRGGQRLLVVEGAVEQWVAGLVGDLQQQRPWRRQHPVQGRRESRVVDHRRRPSVGEEVGQLVVDVPIVDVERGDPGPVRAEQSLQVLRPVVQVQGEMVVRRFPRLGDGAPAAQAVVVQDLRQPPAPLGHLPPGAAPVSPH
jgi:hypothetical protein